MRARLTRTILGALLVLSGCATTSGAGPGADARVEPANPSISSQPPSGGGATAPPKSGAGRPGGAGSAAAVASPPGGGGPSSSQSRGEARAERSSATQVRPGPAHDPAFARGVSAFGAGKWGDAADDFTDALRANPSDVEAQFNLALTQERLGRFDRARGAYRDALRLSPEHLPSLANLARLERQGGHPDAAVQLLQAASQRPDLAAMPELWVQLSAAYRRTGDLAAAETAARKVLALRRDAGGYEALALVALAQGRTRMAQLLADSALKLEEGRASTHVTAGLIAYRMDEAARARTEFERAVALDPQMADGWMNLGALALGWRDYAGAERAYHRAVEVEPWNAEAQLFLADAMAAQRGQDPAKAKAALTTYRQVLSRVPENARAICGAGWTLADSEDRSSAREAQQLLRRCRQLPSTPSAERERIDVWLEALDSPARAGGGAERAGAGVGGAGAVDHPATGREAR